MAKDKSWIGRAASHLAERVKDIPKEIYEHVADRTLPQGAAELSHGLYTGSGYVPYGPGQRPTENEQLQSGQAQEQQAQEKTQQEQARDDQGLEM